MAAVVSQAMLLKNDPELMKFKRRMDNVRRKSQAADSLLHLLVSRANGGVLKSSLFPTYGDLNIDGDEACEVFLEAQPKNKNVVVEASLGVFGNLVAGDLGNMGDDYVALRRKKHQTGDQNRAAEGDEDGQAGTQTEEINGTDNFHPDFLTGFCFSRPATLHRDRHSQDREFVQRSETVASNCVLDPRRSVLLFGRRSVQQIMQGVGRLEDIAA